MRKTRLILEEHPATVCQGAREEGAGEEQTNTQVDDSDCYQLNYTLDMELCVIVRSARITGANDSCRKTGRQGRDDSRKGGVQLDID